MSTGEQQLRTVFQEELAKLRYSAEALSMQPLRARSTSRGSGSRPGTPGSEKSSPRNGRRASSSRRDRPESPRSIPSSFGPMYGGANGPRADGNPFVKLYTPGPGAYTPR